MDLQLRSLEAARPAELEWVARGMQATLIEVEGEAIGRSLHSLDWLRERVRWHLSHPCAAVWLVLSGERIVGHSIVRAEGQGADRHGLVATTYVLPEARRRGIAQRLLSHDEQWMRAQGLDESRTWTGANNRPLIALYERQGYRITQRVLHESTRTPMVCLARMLQCAPQGSPTDP